MLCVAAVAHWKPIVITLAESCRWRHNNGSAGLPLFSSYVLLFTAQNNSIFSYNFQTHRILCFENLTVFWVKDYRKTQFRVRLNPLKPNDLLNIRCCSRLCRRFTPTKETLTQQMVIILLVQKHSREKRVLFCLFFPYFSLFLSLQEARFHSTPSNMSFIK